MKAKPTRAKGKQRKPKATWATARARAEDVARVILDGALFFQLREYVRQQEDANEQPWAILPGGKPLSDSQLRRYVARANQLIGASLQGDRDQLIRDHVGKRRMLFARAVNKGDERTALACARDEAELLALYPAARHEVTGPHGGPLLTVTAVAGLPEPERLQRVRELIAVARSRSREPLRLTYADGGGAGDDSEREIRKVVPSTDILAEGEDGGRGTTAAENANGAGGACDGK